MNIVSSFVREIKFAMRDRSIIVWMAVVLGLSALAVSFGVSEVSRQNAEIDSLIQADAQERAVVSEKLNDWGSAAYYSFHFTYDRPSEFAFAAMGQRDLQPWKHRIRMLALEGQIYERDGGNPVFALTGRFDFAFLVAFILPLVLIMLLYDSRTGERTAGRYNLLAATAGSDMSLWVLRSAVRAGAVFFSACAPLVIMGLITGVAVSTLVLATLYIFLYTLFWMSLCFLFAAWRKPNALILLSLIGIWLGVAVVLPAAARVSIDRIVPMPSGAEILLTQREAVNDAWDLPRQETMDAFFERHPEWSDYKPVKSSFEWQWYYAFQQVGDQRTEPLTQAYKDGRALRDKFASWTSIIALPSLLERSLQRLAKTDQKAAFTYEERVREFHGELRAFYYPKFFKNERFEKTVLSGLPEFGEE